MALYPKKHNGSSRTPRGFSLLELLIAIGVIVLLTGMLIPAVSYARTSARQIQCASNLRQWAAALHAYASQNDGYLPRRGQGIAAVTQMNRDTDWFNALPPLMGMESYKSLAAAGTMARGAAWICPESTDLNVGYAFSYGMNMWLSPWIAHDPDRLERLKTPNTLVFMSDGPSGHCSVVPSKEVYSPVARHRDRINICFVDGHVANYIGAEIGCGVGDPNRSDVQWAIPGSAWPGPH